MNINLVEGEGHKFVLKTTNPKHFGVENIALKNQNDNIISKFSTLFSEAIDNVNNKQIEADKLIIEAGVNPDQVDVAQVMNSIAEAELSLSLTKAVIDRGVRAYQEITTMR